jgi:hypothetical protein
MLLWGAAILLAGCHRDGATAAAGDRFPLGDTLPTALLKHPDGSAVMLRPHLGPRPALLYIFGVDECASCSNLPLEFQIVRRQAPRLMTILIASGASVETFRPRLDKMGLDQKDVLVDEKSVLLHGLGVAREPLVVLVDSTGRVIFVDSRTASRAAQYPVGHILRDIAAVTVVPAGGQ